jgi:hypothetical protein
MCNECRIINPISLPSYRVDKSTGTIILHCITGPAIEHRDFTKEWYINGKKILVNSQEEFEKSTEYRTVKLRAFL